MTIDLLTEAAKDALNEHDFDGVEFEAIEQFVPKTRREDMGDGWHVWIVTADLRSTRVSRGRIQREPMFDVGLIRRLPDKEAGTVKPCLRFAEAVQKFFARDLKVLLEHEISQNEFDPLWSEDHLEQQSVFFSVLNITYKRQPE